MATNKLLLLVAVLLSLSCLGQAKDKPTQARAADKQVLSVKVGCGIRSWTILMQTKPGQIGPQDADWEQLREYTAQLACDDVYGMSFAALQEEIRKMKDSFKRSGKFKDKILVPEGSTAKAEKFETFSALQNHPSLVLQLLVADAMHTKDPQLHAEAAKKYFDFFDQHYPKQPYNPLLNTAFRNHRSIGCLQALNIHNRGNGAASVLAALCQ